MTSPAVRVVKLGGSLLDWPEWVGPFRRWLTVQPPAADVIIVGGGAIVECIRAWDRAHPMADEMAHWLAVDAISLTAAVAAERLSKAKLVRSLDALQLSSTAAPQILDVRQFLLEQHGKPDALPCSWDVTSDSIAAWIAQRWPGYVFPMHGKPSSWAPSCIRVSAGSRQGGWLALAKRSRA